MKYPDVEETVELLLDTARRAAFENGSPHPEDIALAMSVAIETAGPVVMESFKKFNN